MYDQHTRGMASTRHRSLVGRARRKVCVIDKGLAHTEEMSENPDISNPKRTLST